MQEQRISRKVAKLAKKAGFTCVSEYFWRGSKSFCKKDYNPIAYVDKDNIPTQSLLQKWLREDKGFDVIVTRFHIINNIVHYAIHTSNQRGRVLVFNNDHRGYDSYETALEVGLFEILDFIRRNK